MSEGVLKVPGDVFLKLSEGILVVPRGVLSVSEGLLRVSGR